MRISAPKNAARLFVLSLMMAIVPLLGTAAPVRAAEIDVPQAQPTIQAALDAAVAGDVIAVAPGTYTEDIDFHGKDVTLRSSAGPATTRIDGKVTGFQATTVVIGPGGTITGFTISGGTASFGAGMAVIGSGTVIEGNIFSENAQGGGGFGAAIGGNGASPVIQRNVFENNTCDDQFLSGVVSFVNESSPYIANNVFEDNPCRAVSMVLPIPSAPIVVNNTIVRNRTGIYVAAGIETFRQTYRNNIVFGNATGVEVVDGRPGTDPTFDHNLVAANGVNYVGIADQTGINGNLSADPLFRNYAASDYHLQPGSPAIDAGSVQDAPTVDFDGAPRQDGSVDIGAFEAGAPPPSDLPGTGACTTTLSGKLRTVFATTGTTCLEGATVIGSVVVQSGASLSAVNTVVHGALVAVGAKALTICNSRFDGAIVVKGASGFVLIGDGGDGTLRCGGNAVRGGVVLGSTSPQGANTGGLELGGNTVGGSVIVMKSRAPTGGTPTEDNATELEGNHVRGSLVCIGNTPAPVNDGKVNSVAGIKYGQCAGL